MIIGIVISLLFAAGAVVNFTDEVIDWPNALVCSAISALMLSMVLTLWVSRRKASKTLQWLIENKDALTEEPQHFRGGPVFDMQISTKTPLRSYKVVTSFLFITCTEETGQEVRRGSWAAFFAIAWTLVFGWWAFPWGPVRTIQALAHNLSGGDYISAKGAILREEFDYDFSS